MKVNIKLVASLIVALLVVAGSSPVKAETMTDAHTERIRSNCIGAKDSLNRLHTSDALLRVNRGQLYESLTTKLITPFNSRVALNQLDNKQLVAVASDYKTALSSFRQDYIEYEKQLAAAIKIDCQKQPVSFYDAVSSARSKRLVVYDDILKLGQYIDDYESEFTKFVKSENLQ